MCHKKNMSRLQKLYTKIYGVPCCKRQTEIENETERMERLELLTDKICSLLESYLEEETPDANGRRSSTSG